LGSGTTPVDQSPSLRRAARIDAVHASQAMAMILVALAESLVESLAESLAEWDAGLLAGLLAES